MRRVTQDCGCYVYLLIPSLAFLVPVLLLCLVELKLCDVPYIHYTEFICGFGVAFCHCLSFFVSFHSSSSFLSTYIQTSPYRSSHQNATKHSPPGDGHLLRCSPDSHLFRGQLVSELRRPSVSVLARFICWLPLAKYEDSTLDACIASIQGQINSCAQTDYSCLCTQYVNMLTCYANCPNDSDVATVQQQREQYCSAASVYGTTTTLGTAPVTSASTSAAVTDSSQSAVETGFAGASNTGASASPSATGSSSDNGAHGLEVARGLIAMGLAGLGLVL